jgi:hypothetical protein
MKRVILAGLATLFAQTAQANPNCLEIGQLWSWKTPHRKTLIVQDKWHQKFKLGLMGYCGQLPFKLTLGFKSIGGISGLDCVTNGDEVISRDSGMHYTCPIASIVPYTPALEKADKAAANAIAAQPTSP